jgi:virulence-associated protein VagC
MFKTYIHLALILFLSLSLGKTLAQEWEFAKEKDRIKVYTRMEKDSRFKSFKGETEVKADHKSIIALIEDVEKFDDWDEDVSEIKVLEHVPGKMLKYYVVYDVPWPFHDRDLCVEAITSVDQATGTILMQARSIPEAVPLNEDRVRILDYRQKWIVEPKENGWALVTVEGFADPAGDIPAWIANMAITDTPLNMLREIRNRFH